MGVIIVNAWSGMVTWSMQPFMYAFIQHTL